MTTFRVSIARNTQALAAVREAVAALGGISQFVAPGDRVFLKPNNLAPRYIPGTTTSREVVAAVALLVKEVGGRPMVGEFGLAREHAKLAPTDTCAYHYFNALADVGLEKEVPLVDLTTDTLVPVKIEGARVLTETKIARTAFEADKIVDIPVMKTHDQVWVTLGIKNMKGVIPLAEKHRCHAIGVEQAIVDLCKFLPPDLVVIDAMTAAEGLGPWEGTPVRMDVILAGDNALATDLVGTAVMGLDPRKIRYLNNAVSDNLGPRGLDDIDVVGLPIEAVRRDFITAETIIRRQYEEMGIHVVSHNVCSGCWAEFRHIYYSLGEDRVKLNGTTFVLGSVEELPPTAKAVILGKCARALAARGEFVPGCPPGHEDIEKAARRVAGIAEPVEGKPG